MGMPKAKALCRAIRGQPQVGFRCFMSTTAAMSSRLGPFGPGLFDTVDENNRRNFRVVSARWRRSSVEGFRTMATRTSRLGRMSSVHTLATTRSARRKLGGTSPRAIEDQELLLDEYGLSHDGTCAARPDEPDEGRHEVQRQDGQVAHDTMLTSERNPRNAREFGIRHAQDLGAVEGAVTEPWSNGPVECHINRLKTLRRQMYGRAGVDLLRARLLPLPPLTLR
jgi:hypothetical protein